MTDNVITFVGAGPGNPKLITLLGREKLEEADLVVYAGSLVNPEVVNYCSGEKVDSYGLTLDEITKKMADAIKEGKKVVRLHSGDPSLYGNVVEQMEELKKYDITVERVPGVSSVFATAAALDTQLTLNGVSDTLIITRPAGKTLEEDDLKGLSKHNATMAVFLGTQKIEEIMEKVEYSDDTPVAVVFHASWPDQKIVYGTVADIAQKVKDEGIIRSAMILIGGVVDPVDYRRSHLYGVAQKPL
ncbi:precorrin-4 C11-methyltransferase /cobalt-factor II C20-methyltransferase [Methanococcoides vulcani]|uniref:Precorrin-4 C11-methyltransferase /cobalt-factor II C20-methyltransferase n=1 Tax=Methanococcoides vulcani TaxID=1353158 RepID=A0A1I0BB64_9EURY|nr:precorrin-4 C(11)-methyltransferase [Methanococcoides vulcani]SET04059.1 precorrin-4 C11-methyltransferase /cobalt-factor II C20-methyltransferase [Methanococcoides vulcani]